MAATRCRAVSGLGQGRMASRWMRGAGGGWIKYARAEAQAGEREAENGAARGPGRRSPAPGYLAFHQLQPSSDPPACDLQTRNCTVRTAACQAACAHRRRPRLPSPAGLQSHAAAVSCEHVCAAERTGSSPIDAADICCGHAPSPAPRSSPSPSPPERVSTGTCTDTCVPLRVPWLQMFTYHGPHVLHKQGPEQ